MKRFELREPCVAPRPLASNTVPLVHISGVEIDSLFFIVGLSQPCFERSSDERLNSNMDYTLNLICNFL